MFKFLRRDQNPAILAECEEELRRTAVANWQYVSVPRDMNARAELLQKAATAGLAEHETVKRLDFLQRLLLAVNAPSTLAVKEAFLNAAPRYQLEGTSAIRWMRQQRDLEVLEAEGLRIISHDQQGRAVYLQCSAEFKNKPGRLEAREDGVTFLGEVAVEIAWSTVAHAAKTVHSYQGLDYSAVALQEGKRRTPTKFAFTRDDEAAYACEVIMRVWAHKKQAP
jgi:hypothetical protein